MENLEGIGKLISKTDPDENRQWVRENKSRGLEDKTMSVKEAVDKFVKDGDYIFFGFFGTRVPMSLLYEIIRQKKKNLSVGRGGLYDLDILVAAGCVNKFDRAYGGGFEVLGLSSVYRKAILNGQMQVNEWSNATYAWRLKAAAMGLPFLPVRSLMGSDTFKQSSAKMIKCPFTGMKLAAVPACYPDVSMIHVHRCDKYGNAQIDGVKVFDIDAAKAGRKVILTTEEIIDTEAIRSKPWRTDIPHYYVDAVVEVPYGSHPSNMPQMYYMDEEILKEYIQQSKTPEGVQAFFDKYVFGAEDFDEYLKLIGGTKKLRYLRNLERFQEKRG